MLVDELVGRLVDAAHLCAQVGVSEEVIGPASERPVEALYPRTGFRTDFCR